MVSLSPEFVQKLLKRGYSEGSIREVLSESGFTRREIKNAFNAPKNPAKKIEEKQNEAKEQAKETAKKQSIRKSHPQAIIKVSFVAQLLLIGLFAAAVIPLVEPGTLATGLFASEQATDCGHNLAYFKVIAEDCGRATVLKDLEGTILRFSSDNCKITKSIDKFGDTEPEQIRRMFEDKTMECRFERGNLPDELLQGLARGIEYCRGPLKDSLIELSQKS